MLTNSEIPFEIQTLEWAIQKRIDGLFAVHTQKQFEIIWIQEGTGMHIINDEQYSITDNTIYAALPGQRHQLNLHPGTKGYIISFNSSCWLQGNDDKSIIHNASFFHFFFMNTGLALKDEQVEDIQAVFTKLVNEMSRYALPRIEILGKYLEIMMIYLKGQIELSQTESRPEKTKTLLNNFLWLLENNFIAKKAVSEYARELFVTPNYLNFVVKKGSGYSASHHIRHRIVLEAKRKVQNTGATMKEVAYYLGFDDLAHFSKFFKNTSGMNFSAFKKEMTGNYAF